MCRIFVFSVFFVPTNLHALAAWVGFPATAYSSSSYYTAMTLSYHTAQQLHMAHIRFFSHCQGREKGHAGMGDERDKSTFAKRRLIKEGEQMITFQAKEQIKKREGMLGEIAVLPFGWSSCMICSLIFMFYYYFPLLFSN